MKTAIRTILCAVAVVMAAVSCQKSIEPANPAEEGKETIDICVNGLMGEYAQQDGEAVKSSLVNTVRVAWAAGDVVYVFDGSKYLGKLTATLDKKADGQTDEDRYAKLGGTIIAPATTPCVLSLVHSSLMTEPVAGAAVSELSIDMSAQSTATVPFVAYATLKYTGTTITDVVVPFQFATSVIKVNCTGLKPGTAITSATLSNVNTVCKLSLSGAGVQNVSGDVNGTITRTGVEYFSATNVNSEGEAVFQIAVPKLEAASGARILTVAQGSDEVKDKNFSKKAIDPATSVNTVCQLVGLPAGALPGVFSVSSTKKVHFSKGNLYAQKTGDNWTWNFYDEQYKYNSIETSSGMRMAANTDTEIDLFTWGYGTWSTYPTTRDYLTSHKLDGEPFDPSEDWGSQIGDGKTWSTLTKAEWCYLFAYDPEEWEFDPASPRYNLYKTGVKVCGKENCVVIAPDGWNISANYLQAEYSSSSSPMTWEQAEAAGLVCLPAAGTRDGSVVYDVGDSGHYWSSTVDNENFAYDVYFGSGYVAPDHAGPRNGGDSVRLVTE